jgi:hypothetical protein
MNTKKKVGILLLGLIITILILGNIGGKMNHVTLVKELNFSAKVAWKPWTELSNISEFHPDLSESPLISDKIAGVGAKRQVTTIDGKKIIHEIVEWDEANKKHAFKFYADFLPLKNAICRIQIVDRGTSKSAVLFSVEMEPKFGLLGWILGKLVIERKLNAGANHLLDGLETYLKANTSTN